MPSYYDAEKKCRVGTMDQAQFDSECQPENRAYFHDLTAAWTAAGGSLKWGAGGVGLRCPIGGKETGVCFVAPQFAGKKDRIELACAGLTKQIGEGRVQQLQSDLRAAAGKNVLGTSMISIVCPGELSPDGQKALTNAFLSLMG